jgi:NADPH:quinone reductase-like Zn-dependent oxidoreductase
VKRGWKKGDRVFGFAHGGNVMNPETGAFSEFVTARGDILLKIPENLSFEEAATLPVGVMTNVMGLYQHMGLPHPGQKAEVQGKKQILIYGGSTATGMLAIQFVKL